VCRRFKLLNPYTERQKARPIDGCATTFEPIVQLQAVAGYDPQQLRRLTITVEWKERQQTFRVQQETMISNVPRF
jgi:hypothetical protein